MQCLQFLFAHDLEADLLLALPAPVVYHFPPVGGRLPHLLRLLHGPQRPVPALGADLALSHLQVFPHDHHKLYFLDRERSQEQLVCYLCFVRLLARRVF